MREVSALDSNRLSAILLCLGAVLGLVGATPTGFTLFYATLGWTSFSAILLLGAFSFQNRREGRVLALAAMWFALLGGAASVALLMLGLMISWNTAIWFGSLGVVGTLLATAGAAIRILRVTA